MLQASPLRRGGPQVRGGLVGKYHYAEVIWYTSRFIRSARNKRANRSSSQIEVFHINGDKTTSNHAYIVVPRKHGNIIRDITKGKVRQQGITCDTCLYISH